MRQVMSLRLPFGESAVQVTGNSSPHLRHLQPLVVLEIMHWRRDLVEITAVDKGALQQALVNSF